MTMTIKEENISSFFNIFQKSSTIIQKNMLQYKSNEKSALDGQKKARGAIGLRARTFS